MTFQFLMAVFKVPSQDRVQQRFLLAYALSGLWEQIVDIPSPGGSLAHGSSSSAGPADEDFTGVFRTFPRGKKSARVAASPSARVPPHSSSWTSGAYGVVSSLEQPVQRSQVDQGSAVVEDRAEWRVIEDYETGQPYYYNLRTLEIRWTLPPGASPLSEEEEEEKEEEDELALFSLVVLRPLMLDIMAGMDQKDCFMRGFWWLCDVVWW